MVNGLAFRIMGRDGDVDDLVQDSFLEALRNLDRLDNPQAFASWLGSIVVRTAGKRLRKRALLNRLGLRRANPIDADSILSREASPDTRAELARIYTSLHEMHHEARTALVLHRVEGMSLPEAAQQMGISLSTIKRRIQSAERVLTTHHGLPSRNEEGSV